MTPTTPSALVAHAELLHWATKDLCVALSALRVLQAKLRHCRNAAGLHERLYGIIAQLDAVESELHQLVRTHRPPPARA